MELVVKSRSGKVSTRHHSYIEEKLNKLERFMPGIEKITVELSEEQSRNKGPMHRAQATLLAEHGVLLRSDQRAGDLMSAIDEEKHWRRGKLRRENGEFVATPDIAAQADSTEAPTPQIVRTKQF